MPSAFLGGCLRVLWSPLQLRLYIVAYWGLLAALTLPLIVLPQLLSEERLHEPLNFASCMPLESIPYVQYSQDDSPQECPEVILDLSGLTTENNHHSEGWLICVLPCK